MQQQTFTDVEYSKRKKKTRREEFLNMMDKIIPWNEWIDLIKPYYPSGKRGRPTRGIPMVFGSIKVLRRSRRIFFCKSPGNPAFLRHGRRISGPVSAEAQIIRYGFSVDIDHSRNRCSQFVWQAKFIQYQCAHGNFINLFRKLSFLWITKYGFCS